jgi:transposase
MGFDGETVRKRIHRFNAEGSNGLKDRYRSGRPPTYSAEQTAAVIATALTKPQTLGLLFAAWTLDRLAAHLQERKGIAMQRSRIDEILLQEGLRLRKHETWFGERVDPEFAEKGKIETLYTAPPAGSVVICLDEMGPVSAKSSAGHALVQTETRPAKRARQEQDRRLTMAAVPRATSLAPSVLRQVKHPPIPIPHGAVRLGSISSTRLRPGSRARPSGCAPSWIT